MTKFVRFNVVNKEPVELEINDPSSLNELNGRQVQSLHTALDRFLYIMPFEGKEFFDRVVKYGVVYFCVPASGSEFSMMTQPECAQD